MKFGDAFSRRRFFRTLAVCVLAGAAFKRADVGAGVAGLELAARMYRVYRVLGVWPAHFLVEGFLGILWFLLVVIALTQ